MANQVVVAVETKKKQSEEIVFFIKKKYLSLKKNLFIIYWTLFIINIFIPPSEVISEKTESEFYNFHFFDNGFCSFLILFNSCKLNFFNHLYANLFSFCGPYAMASV